MRQRIFASVIWCFAHVLVLGSDVSIQELTTEVGVYEVIRLPGSGRAFELTESRRCGVRVDDYTRGFPDFESFAVEQPDEKIAEVSVNDSHAWTIMGEQLYVGSGVKLEVFQLPSLKPVATRVLRTASKYRTPGQENRDTTVRRVPGGWYCDGYVFDNSGEQLKSVLSFRQASASDAQDIIDDMLKPFEVQRHAGLAEVVALETIPADLQVQIQNGTAVVRILGYDGGYLKGGIHDQFTFQHTQPNRDQLSVRLRTQGNSFSFTLGREGIHVRIKELDAATCDIPTPQRFAFEQPAMLLDDLPQRPSYSFIDGPEHPSVTSSSVHGQGDVRAALEAEVRRFVTLRFNGRGPSIEQFEARLKQHRELVREEFVFTTDRQPVGIPIPHRVQAETQWNVPGIKKNKLVYHVWKEWSEKELVQLIFEDVLAARQKQELDRKRREAQEEKDRVRKAKERERERIAREREERRLAAEEARKQRELELFVDSMSVRRWIAGGLCLVGVVCFFFARVRKQEGDAE